MSFRTFAADSLRADDENPYWMSFSDMMAGLLILFVLACLVLILELANTKSEVSEEIVKLQKAEAVRSAILDEIRIELDKLGIRVQESENSSVLHIPTDELNFRTNSHQIPELSKPKAVAIGQILFERLSVEGRTKYLDTVFVEGHTDSRKSKRDGGNWALSSRRSISLWQLWEKSLAPDGRLSTLSNHTDEALFSVSGYADTRRRVDEEIDELDYKKNRRIDVRITIKRPTIEELRSIAAKL